ncbi:MAG: sodium:proton antiporter NhaD [Pseudomonadota bacterium]|nr:sodium:proton antiporter NhaD [Pseudomonadota bacterium]
MANVALIIFIAAYALVIFEEVIELKKSKPILLAAGLIWFLAAFNSGHNIAQAAGATIQSYGELLLFLLVSFTYVNVLEERHAFSALQARISTLRLSYRQLFWLLGVVTFCLSIVLANMTTALVMGTVALGLGPNNPKFFTLSCINIVVASNAGGAFCPFGDVTSLMLWQAGVLPFLAFFKLFIPALLCWLIPAGFMTLALPKDAPSAIKTSAKMKPYTWAIITLAGVTVFLSAWGNVVLGLPPVMGMLLGLGLLQALVFVMHRQGKRSANSNLMLDSFAEMRRVDWDTLLFFLGVMFALSGLAQFGWLAAANSALYGHFGATTANIIIGPLSALMDNVPLVYGVLQMHPDMAQGQWLLLALAAGVGGSMLSIGSSAGIALMGMAGKNYTFMKHLVWLPAIALGYGVAITAHLMLN